MKLYPVPANVGTVFFCLNNLIDTEDTVKARVLSDDGASRSNSPRLLSAAARVGNKESSHQSGSLLIANTRFVASARTPALAEIVVCQEAERKKQ